MPEAIAPPAPVHNGALARHPRWQGMEEGAMKYRTFGRTGLQVSELVFGGGAVGGIVIHKDDAIKREAIRRALAGGINWVDTAAQYGDGKSEQALAWLLPESGATPQLSTKFGLDVERLEN